MHVVCVMHIYLRLRRSLLYICDHKCACYIYFIHMYVPMPSMYHMLAICIRAYAHIYPAS